MLSKRRQSTYFTIPFLESSRIGKMNLWPQKSEKWLPLGGICREWWDTGKWLPTNYQKKRKRKEKNPDFIAFAHFHGINPLTMVDFKLPMWCHWTHIMHTVCPRELVGASSSTSEWRNILVCWKCSVSWSGKCLHRWSLKICSLRRVDIIPK